MMKNKLQHTINSLLSLVTTLLVMALPVLAIIYASEPIEMNNSYLSTNHGGALFTQTDWVAKKVNEWKPDFVDESIATIVAEAQSRPSTAAVIEANAPSLLLEEQKNDLR